MTAAALLIRETEANYTGPQAIPEHLFASGRPTAEVWTADSFSSGSTLRTGIWVGEPGSINVPAYPEDEVFTVLSGRIELTETDGSKLSVGPGESCRIRKGWVGVWTNVERTRKCYVIATA